MVDTATRPISHAQTGTTRTRATALVAGRRARGATTLFAKADLAQPPAELRRLGIGGRDTDLGSRGRDRAEHGLVDCRPPGGVLDRGHVCLGPAPEIVLGLGQPARGGAHRAADAL